MYSDLLSRHDGLSHRVTSVNGSAPNKRAVGQPPYLPDASQGDQPFEGTNTSIRTSSLDLADLDEDYLQDRPPQLDHDGMLTVLLASNQELSTTAAQNIPNMTNTVDVLMQGSIHIQKAIQDVNSSINPAQPQALVPEQDLDPQQFDYTNPFYDFVSFIDSVGIPEQPIPFFSPDPSLDFPRTPWQPISQENSLEAAEKPATATEETSSFSRFGSRLPSLQPEQEPEKPRQQQFRPHALWDVSVLDRDKLLSELEEFKSVIPSDFVLPSRHALSRYLLGYVRDFHDYLPFLHIPTLSIGHSPPELVLAIAALGSRYCFEAAQGDQLFHVSKAVAMEQIRRRDELLMAKLSESEEKRSIHRNSISPGHNSWRQYTDTMNDTLGNSPSADRISRYRGSTETAQALLLLMAIASWGRNKIMFREGLGIRSVLATLIRQDVFSDSEVLADISWEDWINMEGAKRTKFMVFCNFNFHCIVFNIPPSILSSELNMHLPCSESEWNAKTASDWRELRQASRPEPVFHDSLSRMFSNKNNGGGYSSLGSYILVHALIQHIYLLRQLTRFKPGSNGTLPSSEITALEQALKNWQRGWESNPESSLDPQDPHGPLAFNSTALLRMAYIRLSFDIGPGRALDTQDAVQIARAIRQSPPIQRSRKVTRAVLHAAHALSIPIKLGVSLVARNQLFMRSIQHSLCSLECAFLLSKWLDAVTIQPLDPPLSEGERKLLAFVTSLLNETEFAGPAATATRGFEESSKKLSASVVRVWAKLFKSNSGQSIWDIVDVIGRALDVYADMLDAGSQGDM